MKTGKWRLPAPAPLVLCATVLASLPNRAAFAQFSQQGPKLVVPTLSKAQQGISVSVSADGNTAMVGGNLENGAEGAAWAWGRSGGVWARTSGKLVGSDAVGPARQGSSVSLSADGNTLLVGGTGDNGSVGAAWVFTRSAGIWTQQGPKLVGTGYVGASRQGQAVAVSADGNTALVGGPLDDGEAGAVWVFTRSGGVWTQQGAKLVGTGGSFARQGISVALSSDGSTALVGGGYDGNFYGAAWVFTRNGGVWTQQGPKLVGTGVVSFAAQGSSVSLSADGNTALVGGNNDNGGLGATWVFTRSGGVWTQQGAKLVGTGALGGSGQGTSVSLAADGNTAAVGAILDDVNVGAVWFFTRSGGVWSQLGSKLVGTGATDATSWQGSSVSLSGDGKTALVGGVRDNFEAGAAWVFVASGGGAQSLYTVSPCRVVDTRGANGPLGGPPLQAGASRTFPVSGSCGIPASAASIAANLTVTQPTAGGDLRAYPAGGTLPDTSVINFAAGQTRANNAVVRLGPGGQIAIQCDMPSGSTQLILDVVGYFQ